MLSSYYAGSNVVILERAEMRRTYQVSWSDLVACLWSRGSSVCHPGPVDPDDTHHSKQSIKAAPQRETVQEGSNRDKHAGPTWIYNKTTSKEEQSRKQGCSRWQRDKNLQSWSSESSKLLSVSFFFVVPQSEGGQSRPNLFIIMMSNYE